MPPVGSSCNKPHQRPNSLSTKCSMVQFKPDTGFRSYAQGWTGSYSKLTLRSDEYLEICKIQTPITIIIDYKRVTMTNYQKQIPNTVSYKNPPVINELQQFTFNQALHPPLGRPDVRNFQPDGLYQRAPVSLCAFL